MNACCSNLKCLKESVIDDMISLDKIRCGSCGASLIAEKVDGYKNVWISPDFCLIRFRSLIKKHGVEQALRNNLYKHEREAWVSAMWALGLSSKTGKEYWVEIELKEDTPDTYIHSLDIINGNNHELKFNV